MEFVRFFVVTVTGLVLDLTVAWSLAYFLGVPLWLAAAFGFSLAATLNYALHEFWTFPAAAARLSASRTLRYAIMLAATLCARITTVAVLAALLGSDRAATVLLAGVIVSFSVNFLLSKHFVFGSDPSAKDPTS